MKIDLHVHASERSSCAISNEESQICSAIAAGLNAIAFTDHHRLVPLTHLAELNQFYAPFIIYNGIEVTADREDWLVYGVYHPRLERDDWHYPDLAAFVHQLGGFLVLAHPFRYAPYLPDNLAACPPDGIEISSYNTPLTREVEIRSIAAGLSLALFSNSDAHSSAKLGKYYNVFPLLPTNDQELVESLFAMKLVSQPH